MTNLEPTLHYRRTTEIIPLKVRNKTGLPAFTTLIQYSFWIPSQRNKTRGRNKRDSSREGRSQIIPICRWHDPISKRPQKLYQKSTRNHKLESSRLQNKNTEISSFSTNNAQTEKEIRGKIPFTINSKTISCLGLNLIEETKEL
jgi:hypothetical protein